MAQLLTSFRIFSQPVLIIEWHALRWLACNPITPLNYLNLLIHPSTGILNAILNLPGWRRAGMYDDISAFLSERELVEGITRITDGVVMIMLWTEAVYSLSIECAKISVPSLVPSLPALADVRMLPAANAANAASASARGHQNQLHHGSTTCGWRVMENIGALRGPPRLGLRADRRGHVGTLIRQLEGRRWWNGVVDAEVPMALLVRTLRLGEDEQREKVKRMVGLETWRKLKGWTERFSQGAGGAEPEGLVQLAKKQMNRYTMIF